jgi:alpha-glucosidase (family GH31 glycosyl hydrolase)
LLTVTHTPSHRPLPLPVSAGATVAFDPANVTYHRSLFKNMIKPLDDAGLQFWWIDFQQGPFSSVPYLNPTIALNYAYWTNPYRFGQDTAGGRGRDRPYVMGRWGGLGGHRYPIGFVGDTYSKWNVLRYESYFMPTASNVGFQWTHGAWRGGAT